VSTQSDTYCRHLWQPYADAARIWEVCQKCGTERHVTTHVDQRAETLRWIMGER
jgi:hypothetical protein